MKMTNCRKLKQMSLYQRSKDARSLAQLTSLHSQHHKIELRAL